LRDLLDEIARAGHGSNLRDCQEALRDVAAPVERLHAFVEAFVRWHARFSVLARVSQYEIAWLSAPCAEEIRSVRRQFREIVQAELENGIASGDFIVVDTRGTARAILSLGIDVARWYREGQALLPEELGTQYADLVLRMVRPWSANGGGATG
jgi:AcrR family transcriptional regulator